MSDRTLGVADCDEVDMGYVTPCWVWRGAISTHGYGSVKIAGRVLSAHRVIYQQEVEAIPDGFTIDHLCRIRACIRPSHLEAVTRSENIARSPLTGAYSEHCKHGHPYTPENTYRVPGSGVRHCRTCRRGYQKKAWSLRHA